MKVDRMLRVNELIRRELGSVIERDLTGYLPALVTITEVRTSPDLQQATVKVSVLGTDAQRRQALEQLNAHRRVFQAHLARHVRIKYTPVITFVLDLTLEKADRVLALLDELQAEASPPPAAPDATAGGGDDAPPEE